MFGEMCELVRQWLCLTIHSAMAERNTAKHTPSNQKWENYIRWCLHEYIALRKRCKKFFLGDLENLNCLGNRNKFSNLVTPSKSNIQKMLLVSQEGLHISDAGCPNVMNSYFFSVLTLEPTLNIPSIAATNFSQMLPVVTTSDGVTNWQH